MVLLSHAPHVHDGITHAAESCVDADVCQLGYFLEREVLVETHADDLALRVRKLVHKLLDVSEYLRSHELVLDIGVLKVGLLKHVGIVETLLAYLVFALASTEIVNNKVMRHTTKEREEFVVCRITMLSDDCNGTEECVLENVVRYIFVLDIEKYIRENSFIMSVEE